MFISQWKRVRTSGCCLAWGQQRGKLQTPKYVCFAACLPVSRCYSQEHLNTQCAEISDYFAKRCRRLCLVRLNGQQLRFQVFGRRALRWQRLFQQQCRGTFDLQIRSFRWRCDGLAACLRPTGLREARQAEQQHL